MKTMNEKTTGYALLIIGILIMLFSVFSVYQVFTKKVQPAQLFNLPAPQLDISQMLVGSMPQEFAGLMKPGNTQELISARMINEPLNITAHLFLMGFVASMGFKLASLGVLLVRTIVVKVKEKSNA